MRAQSLSVFPAQAGIELDERVSRCSYLSVFLTRVGMSHITTIVICHGFSFSTRVGIDLTE
ncbi:MAG: hypothetical protein BWY63_02519 [Chloroflexi bacterium ADurb.Bin360]|nr:MAG: hypothetical protein BWY63_02519 [Chloroflexi bacterium ADurb.Bin360]